MNKQEKINRGFFTAILYSFKDLDKSISEQIEIRNRERQLLPLLYFTCLILLLSQVIQVTSEAQRAPYLSVITAVIVSYLFFLPIFMYITSFILHLALLNLLSHALFIISVTMSVVKVCRTLTTVSK